MGAGRTLLAAVVVALIVLAVAPSRPLGRRVGQPLLGVPEVKIHFTKPLDPRPYGLERKRRHHLD